MSDFDINYIKQQFCKYKCNIGTLSVSVDVEDSVYCDECDRYIEGNFNHDVTLDKTEICKYCQINNFIKELQDFKIIKVGA